MSNDYKTRVLKEFEEKFVKRTDPSTIGSSRSEMVAPMDILTVRKPDEIKAFLTRALDGQLEALQDKVLKLEMHSTLTDPQLLEAAEIGYRRAQMDILFRIPNPSKE